MLRCVSFVSSFLIQNKTHVPNPTFRNANPSSDPFVAALLKSVVSQTSNKSPSVERGSDWSAGVNCQSWLETGYEYMRMFSEFSMPSSILQ